MNKTKNKRLQMNKYSNESKKRVIQYLIDISESLNCSLDDLIEAGIFEKYEDVRNFAKKEEGGNFCILKKNKLSKEFLFFIPVCRDFYLFILHVEYFSLFN